MNTLAAGLSALALLTAAPALAGNFAPKDLFALQYAADPQMRPDGREIAYVRVGYDAMTDKARRAIWLVDTQSGEQHPLGATTAGQSAPGIPQVAIAWLT